MAAIDIELHIPRDASAWMRLPSGRRIDLANPDPCAWTDYDLSLRLARVYRWGGESIHTVPLSVAQHALSVLALRRLWASAPLTVDQQLRELLHDAEEALLGFDCISKLKPLLGGTLRTVSDRLSRAVALRYALPEWAGQEYAEHKHADVACAASEALHCAGWSRLEIGKVLNIAGRSWSTIPWPSGTAARLGSRGPVQRRSNAFITNCSDCWRSANVSVMRNWRRI